jgi:hypothetical protein
MITHEFFVGTRVSLTDARGEHHGTVIAVWSTGIIEVEWDSGVRERCRWEELEKQPF